MTDFDRFWSSYPRKIGKLDAQKAYTQARRVASAEDILRGVEAYKVGKPEYADWKLPAGWLRAGRWMDEYDEPQTLPPSLLDDWFHECQELHNGECGGSLRHRTKMLIERDKKAAGL